MFSRLDVLALPSHAVNKNTVMVRNCETAYIIISTFSSTIILNYSIEIILHGLRANVTHARAPLQLHHLNSLIHSDACTNVCVCMCVRECVCVAISRRWLRGINQGVAAARPWTLTDAHSSIATKIDH